MTRPCRSAILQESSSKKDHDWKDHDWKDYAWERQDWKEDWRRGEDDAYWKDVASLPVFRLAAAGHSRVQEASDRRGSKGKAKGNAGKEYRGWEDGPDMMRFDATRRE